MKQRLEYRDGALVYAEHHHKSRIGTPAGTKRPNGYWYYNNRLVHRIVWEMHNGPVPAGMFIDHIDGDVDNNALENLRAVTPSQSSANRGPMKVRELPKGVRQYRGKFRAYIDSKHLGTYATADAAHAARVQHETIYHREAKA